MRNSGIAAVLSFFIPGLGQIYNGEFAKAAGFILGTLIAGLLTHIYIGFPLLVVIWIWAIVDAYNSGKRLSPSQAD